MSEGISTCPQRADFAAALLERSGRSVVEIGCVVNFGTWEYPDWDRATYVGRGEQLRFHKVRRAGQVLTLHDHQFEPAFVEWLAVNPYPYGRVG